MDAEDIFDFDYDYIVELIEMEVSTRRRNASILGLLTTRNALHKYLKDGKHEVFDDLLE
jgi:hypothetical protein